MSNPQNLEPSIIKKGVDVSDLDKLQNWGIYLAQKNLTTSQFRKFFGATQKIAIEVAASDEAAFEKIKSEIYLLEPKLAYAAGKESDRNKKEVLKQFYLLNSPLIKAITSKYEYLNYVKVLEGILAFHKLNVEKDK